MMNNKKIVGRNHVLGFTLAILSAAAHAAPVTSTSIDINVVTSAANPSVVRAVELPDMDGLHSVEIGLAHQYANDLWIGLLAPNGDLFELTREAFTAGAIGLSTGSPTLANVAVYVFQETGNSFAWGANVGGLFPSSNGPFTARAWFTGPYAAGTWTLSIIDTFPSVDFGAVGSVTFNYFTGSGPGGPVAVPTPATLTLLGSALLLLVASRRRSFRS